MSAETLDLATEAVADPHWRWLPGMLDTDGHRVVLRWSAKAGHVLRRCHDVGLHEENIEGDWLPDLDDAATLGCLLSLVREAWGDLLIHVWPIVDDPDDTGELFDLPPEWIVSTTSALGHRNMLAEGHVKFGQKRKFPSEAAALVAALRGAP